MTDTTAVMETLQDIVESADKIRNQFVRRPNVDFIRHRLLDFITMIWIMLKWGAGTLRKELLEFFDYWINTPTASAFVEQRHKMLPEVFMYIFDALNAAYPFSAEYKGFHLMAVDGTYLPISPNPDDTLTYVKPSDGSRPYAQLRLCLLYDLLEKRYNSVRVEPFRGKCESQALIEMIDSYQGPPNTLIIADRAYEAWNTLAHLQESGCTYLIRIKAPTNAGGIARGLPVPKHGVFDEMLTVTLSHSKAAAIKALPGYKWINRDTALDYLDRDNPTYTLPLRIVQLRVENGELMTFVTNTSKDVLTTADIRELYGLRWGIESSFSSFKYDEGLMALHSRTPEFILQEVYARLVVFNFDSLLMQSVEPREVRSKYKQQLNRAAGVTLCRALIWGKVTPQVFRALMMKMLLPIRKNHATHPRRRRSKPVSFRYRAP